MGKGKPVEAAPWAYSKLKAFEQCPKQFYHERVLREFPFKETEAMRYGNEFHKACEEYVRDGKALPGKFDYIKPTLDALIAKPGDKYCEQKLGLTEDLEPCGFFDKNVWWRGIIDLLIIDGDRAFVVDYKTGKSAKYADRGQLEQMAMAVFKHYPVVKHVNAGLLFVVAEEFIKDKYLTSEQDDLWLKWIKRYQRMEKAFENGVWNPRPSGLCHRHCPVLECPHNGQS